MSNYGIKAHACCLDNLYNPVCRNLQDKHAPARMDSISGDGRKHQWRPGQEKSKLRLPGFFAVTFRTLSFE